MGEISGIQWKVLAIILAKPGYSLTYIAKTAPSVGLRNEFVTQKTMMI